MHFLFGTIVLIIASSVVALPINIVAKTKEAVNIKQLTREKVPTVIVKGSELQPIKNLTALIQTLVKQEVEKAIEELKASQNLTKLLENDLKLKVVLSTLNNETEPLKPNKKNKPHQVYYIRRRPESHPPRPFVSGTQEDSSFYTTQKFTKRKSRSLAENKTGNSDYSVVLNDDAKPMLDESARGILSSISISNAGTSLRALFTSLSSRIPTVSLVAKTIYLPTLKFNG